MGEVLSLFQFLHKIFRNQISMSYLLIDYFCGQDWISWTLGETVVFRKSVKEQLMDILTGLCKWISDLPMLY